MMNFAQYYQIFTESVKMDSIPHLTQMSINDLLEFSDKPDYEPSEKVDGSFSSFGLINNAPYLKSKKGAPTINPKYYSDLAKDSGIDNLNMFAKFLTALINNNFVGWHKDAMTKFKSEIDQAASGAKGIILFAELLNTAKPNTIEYDSNKIGSGAAVLFGAKLDNGTPEGIDVSSSQLGKDIMGSFISFFNGKNNIKVYMKPILKVNLYPEKMKEIHSFITNNKESLTSRKQADKDRKEKMKKELNALLINYNNLVLGQIKSSPSFLGKSNVEGTVLRNINNNSIAKIVNPEYIEQNKENWTGIKAMKDIRSDLYGTVVKEIGKSADILTNKGKPKQKVEEYLEANNMTKFDNIEQMLQVIYDDMKGEVTLDKPDVVIGTLQKISKEYVEKLNTFINSAASSQGIDDANKKTTVDRMKIEIKNIDNLIKNVQYDIDHNVDPYIRLVNFMLNNRIKNELRLRYLK